MSDPAPEAVPFGEAGVQALVDRHGDRALGLVMKVGIARAEAEAIVNEAYVALVKTWQQRGSLEEPQTLLYRALRQRLANEFRRRRRKPASLVDSDDGLDAAASAIWLTQFSEGLIKRVDVANALKELPPRQRAVLELRFRYDLEITAVAELLGCTANDVKYAQKVGIESMKRSRWLPGYAVSPEVHQ